MGKTRARIMANEVPKSCPAMWRDHRQHRGNKQRRHEVDEHRVGGYALNVATKFSGDHGTRSGGGTNRQQPFDDVAAISTGR